MARITFTDKETYQSNDLEEKFKVTAGNMNAIKTAINDLYDRGRFIDTGWDASGNVYPGEGQGSGEAGAIRPGDEWPITVAGNLTVPGTGSIPVTVGMTIKALTATPGQTPTNWKVYQ